MVLWLGMSIRLRCGGSIRNRSITRRRNRLRKILIVGTLLLLVFVAVFRQRIFVRDPLGKVERNGVAQDGERLYINYSNDVLVEDSSRHQFVLVQGWSALPGVPQRLVCLTGLVCWT